MTRIVSNRVSGLSAGIGIYEIGSSTTPKTGGYTNPLRL